jgi:hypothetical protein
MSAPGSEDSHEETPLLLPPDNLPQPNAIDGYGTTGISNGESALSRPSSTSTLQEAPAISPSVVVLVLTVGKTVPSLQPGRGFFTSLKQTAPGVFIAQLDTSFVLATHTNIASEFGQLSNSSWLVVSYALAMCASQPVYGKLSDIYGRKEALVFAYLFFGVGWYVSPNLLLKKCQSKD